MVMPNNSGLQPRRPLDRRVSSGRDGLAAAAEANANACLGSFSALLIRSVHPGR